MDHDIARAFSMILQIGISILVPTFLCLFVGLWLDQRWGIGSTIPLLVLGILAGGRNAFILAKKNGQQVKKRRSAKKHMICWGNGKRESQMEKKNDQLRETVREIIIGIFACGILELLVCFLFVGGNPLEISMVKLKSMAGIFMGCMIAIGWFFHMEKSLREAMALGESGPASYQKRICISYDSGSSVTFIGSIDRFNPHFGSTCRAFNVETSGISTAVVS